MAKYVKEKELKSYEKTAALSKKVKDSYLSGGVTGQQAITQLMTGGFSKDAASILVYRWREVIECMGGG